MIKIDTIKSDFALIYIDQSQKTSNITCSHLFETEHLTEPLDVFPEIKTVGTFDVSGMKIGFMFDNNWTKKTCSICGEIQYERKYYYRPIIESNKTFRQGKKELVIAATSSGKTAIEIVSEVRQFAADFEKKHDVKWQYDIAAKGFVFKQNAVEAKPVEAPKPIELIVK